MLSKPAVHIAEVGVNMVCVPVQGVVLGAKVVPGEVASRVAETVELVPQETPRPYRDRDYASTENVVWY